MTLFRWLLRAERLEAGRPRWLRALRMASLGLLAWLSGCAIGTPYPSIPVKAPQGQPETVVLVLTRVIVNTQQRSEFDRQTRRAISGMSSQPGLLGYSARREVFGRQAWTMSVWATEEDRQRFVQGAVHREAIAKGMSGVVTVDLKRLTVQRKDVPADWPAAIKLLADPQGLRNYWE